MYSSSPSSRTVAGFGSTQNRKGSWQTSPSSVRSRDSQNSEPTSVSGFIWSTMVRLKARSASSSTRPASVVANCSSTIVSGWSGWRFTQNWLGSSASQVLSASEDRWTAASPPNPGSASSGSSSAANEYAKSSFSGSSET